MQTRREVIEEVPDDAYDRRVARTDADQGMITAARVISFIGGFICTVLALRFLLALLGANRGNAIAAVIYDISRPFVAPFFGLFNYQQQFGVVRFEFETLIAILVYALITYGLVRLITIGRRPTARVS
jgi:YggT family protein